METVNVNKSELRKIVEDNREHHRELFDEAVEGYTKKVTKDLEKYLERVKKGSLESVYIRQPVPVDHTDDYDRILRMLEMHIGDEIEISQNDFARYVMDDWDWKGQFADAYTANTGKFAPPRRS